METVIQQAVNGLASASSYALIGIGITLIFGLTRIVNFAHGQFLVIGGLVTWAAVDAGLPYLLAATLAVLASAGLGWITERLFFRPTLEEPIRGFIVSLGLIIVIEHAAVKVWGPDQKSVAAPLSHVFSVGELRIHSMRIAVFVAAALAFSLFYWLLVRTRWGRSVRAIASDPETASTMGVPVGRYISGVFMVGSALAGLAGAMLIALFPMSPFSGEGYVIKGFAVAIIGGLGNVSGAVVAALLLGVIEAVAAGYLSPAWSTAYAFGGMIVIVLFRPSGLLRGAH